MSQDLAKEYEKLDSNLVLYSKNMYRYTLWPDNFSHNTKFSDMTLFTFTCTICGLFSGELAVISYMV